MARILLIEPDAVLAKLYAEALRRAGYTVDRAAEAQSAVNTADTETPDVVVLELQLVAHSGIEFLYEFRSYTEWQNVPVIVHSHVPPSEFEGTDLLQKELGITTYLYKPQTTLAELVSSVRRQVLITS
ncbi:MAG TPA: response regulator [Candidatus Saccharimonadales bacterium]|nr:response regulator [Candidatus Saccharimonadales bacterium]